MSHVTHTWRTTWPASVPETGSAVLTAVLRDEDGDPVPGSSLSSCTLTLLDRASQGIINSQDETDVQADVDVNGVLTVDLTPDDNPILNDALVEEWHVARIRYAWAADAKQGFHELHFPVANLALIPAAP